MLMGNSGPRLSSQAQLDWFLPEPDKKASDLRPEDSRGRLSPHGLYECAGSQNSSRYCAILLDGRWSNRKAADDLAGRCGFLEATLKTIVLKIPGTKASRAAYISMRAADGSQSPL